MRSTAELLGEVARRRRERLGLTLGQVSAGSGIDVSQLSKIERGECATSVDGFEALARALGYSDLAAMRIAARRFEPHHA